MKNNIFSEKEGKQVKEAIQKAETTTSGEIRVHIDKKLRGDVLDRAAHVFKMLEMHKTELRNGVLFYLAIEDKKFAILGDAGINNKVPKDFWDQIKEEMVHYFKKDDFVNGLTTGINMAGEKLQEHFPYMGEEDINELSDDISYGDKN